MPMLPFSIASRPATFPCLGSAGRTLGHALDRDKAAPPAKSLLFSAAMSRPKLTILLASPRGFCAGVDRAIQIVEQALQRYGPPVYVRHEIVHNRTVVAELEAKGAVFVEELDSVPAGAPVIFSAH